MSLSESGSKVVATFTRQITEMVTRIERSEAADRANQAAHEKEMAEARQAWEREYATLCQDRDTARAELIDRNARLDLVEGELTVLRADHGMLTREYNAQTAALESLRRSAAQFGHSVQDVLGKNLEADQASENMRGAGTDFLEQEVRDALAGKAPREVVHIGGPR